MDMINTLLTRGVEKIYPSKEALEKILRSGKKLRVYQGFDPTSPQLHIGHMIGFKKLRQWQDLGHKVIFLIGDFTATIGDPSGKSESRKLLTHKEILKNAHDYKLQASRILNFSGKNPVEIKYNSQWLGKLTTQDFLRLIHFFSAQQIIKRDMFQDRLKSGQDLFLNEFFYPVLQAYDSVMMDIDVEVGGNDQLFNMLAGRDLMHKMKRKNKFVMTTPLLVDASGKKIGKTEGNVIALLDKPNDLYGKIMTLGDDVIVKALEYLTDIPMEKVTEIDRKMRKGENPMRFKKLLAFEVVKFLNSEQEAKDAQTFFEQAHQKGQTEILENVPTIKGKGLLVKDIIASNLSLSASEVKRLISQNAIDINGKTVTDPKKVLQAGELLRVGKKHIFRIK